MTNQTLQRFFCACFLVCAALWPTFAVGAITLSDAGAVVLSDGFLGEEGWVLDFVDEAGPQERTYTWWSPENNRTYNLYVHERDGYGSAWTTGFSPDFYANWDGTDTLDNWSGWQLQEGSFPGDYGPGGGSLSVPEPGSFAFIVPFLAALRRRRPQR